jgi:hypothetical protein
VLALRGTAAENADGHGSEESLLPGRDCLKRLGDRHTVSGSLEWKGAHHRGRVFAFCSQSCPQPDNTVSIQRGIVFQIGDKTSVF